MLFLQKKWSPLLQAAFEGNVELVKILLKSGAHVDIIGPVRLFEGLYYR